MYLPYGFSMEDTFLDLPLWEPFTADPTDVCEYLLGPRHLTARGSVSLQILNLLMASTDTLVQKGYPYAGSLLLIKHHIPKIARSVQSC